MEINYCEKCDHTGFIRIDNNSVYQCECYKPVNALRRLYNEGLGGLLEKCTFDRFETNKPYQKTMKDKALEYTKDKSNKWFTILAKSGTGKTHICISILNELIKQGKECYYIRWNDFVSQLNASVNSERYFDILDRIENYEVLYIDDFLKPLTEKMPTQAELKKAYELIDYRLINNKKTIISSERTKEDLIEIDEAIAGRIIEMSKGYLLLAYFGNENRNYRLNEVKL